jgi:hypothetical protein
MQGGLEEHWAPREQDGHHTHMRGRGPWAVGIQRLQQAMSGRNTGWQMRELDGHPQAAGSMKSKLSG